MSERSMEHRINVSVNSSPNEGYEVLVGPGVLSAANLGPWVNGRRVLVVTSAPIRALHGQRLEDCLRASGEVCWLEVPDGEIAKDVATAESLWNRMLDGGGKRDSLVVAFGGGSIGDLGGFAAATFLRGVDFLQVPTTLLAQVDASVGGKVAVDLAGGKNTVGAFYQPKLVVADVNLLSTLSQRDLASGLVESAKMGAVLALDLLELVEANVEAVLGGDGQALAAVVARSVEVKAGVVEKDPYEKDLRRLLNFGHTLGHAIEVALDYQHLRHGEAVAWGMLFAVALSQAVPGCELSEDEGRRIERLVERLNPASPPPLAQDVLLRACAKDKKAMEDGLAWVLCPQLGKGLVRKDVSQELVVETLGTFLGRFSR